MVKTKLFLPVFLLVAVLMLSATAVTVQASTFGGVSGKVTDSAGKPVAGAQITLVGAGATVTTDKSGEYDLEGITPGDYPLKAAKTGYQTTSVTVTITQDVPLELDLTLTPS